MIQIVRTFLPGLALLTGMALVARVAAEAIPTVNALILVIVLGIGIGNVIGVPAWAEGGVGEYKLILETGIVIMGARVALDQLFDVGPWVFLLVFAAVVFTLLYVEFLSKYLFGLAEKTGSLLAAGLSICGVSAIVAVAGSIKANEEATAYAVATILFFDAVTLFAYPLIGTFLELSDQVFGIWAGISMFSTGPVVAAGFAYSEPAGQWATITKLTRNTFIGFAAIGYALYYAQRGTSSEISNKGLYIWNNFPKFIIGFVMFMFIVSFGLVSDAQVSALNETYNWLFAIAFAGLGLNIRFSDMRDTGGKPIALGIVTLLTVSMLSLGLLMVLFNVAL